MTGKTAAQMADLRAGSLEDVLGGLSPESKHAAILSVDGVRAILAEFRRF